mmetsp:Transcript_67615/g.220096  ORF Transcript_67615/g.220096 Transcript_67615/m.220096 type:complete len:292 (+) Transcript_67615:137-1012(+)
MSGSGVRSRAGDGGGQAAKKSETHLSVVVPTYNETENIRPLTERLFKTMKDAGLTAELIFVDDESPGSEESERIVKELAQAGHPVRIHCRKKTEGRGLSSAVLLGFEQAKYKVLLCMDADLQHEPEAAPAVAAPVMEGRADFSVGSRHAAGGGLGFSWSIVRQVISHGATMLAWPVAKSTDPMSGFFCTTREILDRGRGTINPIGFKIGLEIMVRCRCQRVQDVGIMFQERAAGESKLSAKHYKFYVQQLAALYWDKYMDYIFLVVLLVFGALILFTTWMPHQDTFNTMLR